MLRDFWHLWKEVEMILTSYLMVIMEKPACLLKCSFWRHAGRVVPVKESASCRALHPTGQDEKSTRNQDQLTSNPSTSYIFNNRICTKVFWKVEKLAYIFYCIKHSFVYSLVLILFCHLVMIVHPHHLGCVALDSLWE